MLIIFLFVITTLIQYAKFSHAEDLCEAEGNCSKDKTEIKEFKLPQRLNGNFITFHVNPGEGLNLRRQVLVRIILMMKKLLEDKQEWTLILPKICKTPHVKKHPSDGLLWSRLIDIERLSKYVPVIDYDNYILHNGPLFDNAMFLQRKSNDFTSQWWKEVDCPKNVEATAKIRLERCGEMKLNENGTFMCVDTFSFCDQEYVVNALQNYHNTSLFLQHAEVLGWGSTYWTTRLEVHKYLHPAKWIKDIAENYVKTKICDGVIDCRFFGYHMRRGDFLSAHSDVTPPIKDVAEQIAMFSETYDIKLIYISTDGKNELETLREMLPKMKVISFELDEVSFSELESSVIEQTVLAYSSVFIGTPHSTFSHTVRDYIVSGYPTSPDPKKTLLTICSKNRETGKYDCPDLV